jgi:spore germination cell wall hydrolase CwlJ-like protein
MSAVPIRFSCVMRTAASAVAAAFLLSSYAVAEPLSVSLRSIAAIKPQAELAHPSLVPESAGLSRAARMKRMRIELVRMRRARAEQQARIRQYRSQLARFERQGSLHCLSTAVYFEARDEPIKGQHAVAAVILARTKVPGRPRTVCGVVFEGAWRKTGCQFSFACDGRIDIPRWQERWVRAQQSAAYVWNHQHKTRGIVRGATFYHTKFVHPRWDKQMIRVARIGLHIFYRPRRGRLS